MKRAASLKYKDIPVGKKASFKHFISRNDVENFARLSGDFNPLHLDEKFAGRTAFKGTIVHGMLAASLFSKAIGMYCPGRYALILTQEIKYIKPVKPDSEVRVSCRVVNKTDSVKVLLIESFIEGTDGTILVEGINKIRMMR